MGKAKNGAASWVTEMAVNERDTVILGGGDPDGDEIGQRIAAKIKRLRRRGHTLAKFTADIALVAYCIQAAGRVCRQDKVEAAIGWNGDVVRHQVAERISFPKRDKSGAVKSGAGTYRMWVDVPRDEFFQKLAAWEREHDERGRNVAVLRKGAVLLIEHPDAMTVRQACEMAGLDWQEFLLEEESA